MATKFLKHITITCIKESIFKVIKLLKNNIKSQRPSRVQVTDERHVSVCVKGVTRKVLSQKAKFESYIDGGRDGWHSPTHTQQYTADQGLNIEKQDISSFLCCG